MNRSDTGRAYLPFGAGPRACVGMGLGMLELQLPALEIAATVCSDLRSAIIIWHGPSVMTEPDAPLNARFRPRLEVELAKLMDERDATAEGRAPVQLDQQSVGRLSRMDAMQIQQMALAAGRQRDARINRIRNALDRMKRGEFGYCVACGDDILEARLEADPSVPFCVGCASAK